ncbi:hypothetical protein HDU79_004818 [Rhizoclosmatium sp. JEL0117]|nr:hypothetical protein HDU79_004818 [Rhizoclosmatium sp. JEL0117]
MDTPSFRHFAIATAFLGLKMCVLGGGISLVRGATSVFPTPEDEFFSRTLAYIRPKKSTVTPRTPDPNRAAHSSKIAVQLNACLAHDVANVPILLILGFAYVATVRPTESESARVFATLVLARYAHSVVYLLQLQPYRFLAHAASIGTGIEMAIRILVA